MICASFVNNIINTANNQEKIVSQQCRKTHHTITLAAVAKQAKFSHKT